MKFLLLAFTLLLVSPAFAHKSSDSYLDITIAASGFVSARWDIALRDLDLLLAMDADNDQQLTWGEVQAATPAIQALALASLTLSRGAQPCTLASTAPALRIERHVDGQYAVLAMQGQCDARGPVQIDYRLLANVDANHRGILGLHAADREHTFIVVPGTPLRVADDSAVSSGLGYVREGMHHIATGYDHLLFLLSLLLPVALTRVAPGQHGVRGPVRDAMVLVTAFTVAHSLTLALAALDVVKLPSRLVESAIAASVLVAALHNLRRHQPRTRWLMAFVFGLIHGFGFAAMLQGLPTSLGSRVLALAGFNLGVEIGQLLAVMLVLPIAILIATKHRTQYQRWGVQVGSLSIAAMALVWLYQRALPA